MTVRHLDPRVVVFRASVGRAVASALAGEWASAVEANRLALRLFPGDVESHNRMGKALGQLGRIEEARAAYSTALGLAPGNRVATRNLDRFERMNAAPRAASGSPPPESGNRAARALASFFIGDRAKAAVAKLVRNAGPEVLLTVEPGDLLTLALARGGIEIRDRSGRYLGALDLRLGSRLARLVQGGNRYEAIASGAGTDGLSVLLRELYRAPSQAGTRSFDIAVEPAEEANIESAADYRAEFAADEIWSHAHAEDDPEPDAADPSAQNGARMRDLVSGRTGPLAGDVLSV